MYVKFVRNVLIKLILGHQAEIDIDWNKGLKLEMVTVKGQSIPRMNYQLLMSIGAALCHGRSRNAIFHRKTSMLQKKVILFRNAQSSRALNIGLVKRFASETLLFDFYSMR